MRAGLILKSERPIVLIGNGCIRGNASTHLRMFLERTGLCSMNTFMAKGVISDRSERHLQTIGIRETDHALIAMKNEDLVIAVGYDLVEYSPRNWNGDLAKSIIHIDFSPAEVDTYYSPSVEIAADIEYSIDAILKELEKQKIEYPNMKGFPYREIPEQFKKIKTEVTWRIERFRNDMHYPIKPEKSCS